MSKPNSTAQCTESDNKNRNYTHGSATSSSSVLAEKIDNKNIDIEDPSQGTDSGFLSGPLSSFCEEQETETYNSSGNNANNFNKTKQKIVATDLHTKNISGISQPHDKSQESAFVVDSGCIEEEEYEECNDSDAKSDCHTISKQQTLQGKPRTATTENQSSNLSEEMKLKHDVDSHISERFCNLSLQSGTSNNLNASGRVSTEQTAAISNNPLELTQKPEWQQFFQQNDDGDTYLHLACISGLNNVVDALIRLAVYPCILNIKNDYGQTPLHLAALSRHHTILRMLLLAGADPNARDGQGNTALHIACKSGDEQGVSALTTPFSDIEINAAQQQYGCTRSKLINNFDIRNYDGEYCVHLAAEIGNIPILMSLVRSGADINEREGKGGYTPLHIAVEKCNEELFHFLLNYCKPTLNLEETTFGRLTAYQLACILERTQMQRILEKHGAEQLPAPDNDYESSDEESE